MTMNNPSVLRTQMYQPSQLPVPFSREQTEVLNARHDVLLKKIDATVSGASKRAKTLIFPTEIVRTLRSMQEDIPIVFGDTEAEQQVATKLTYWLELQINRLEGGIQEIYREMEEKRLYKKRPL